MNTARLNPYRAAFISGLVIAAAAALWVSSARSRTALAVKPRNIQNVVVVLIDTLRADHLPFYGYAKNTAPFLNELARRSVVFERAFSACSSTAPATASIFTSMYPSEHGVITGHIATQNLLKRHSYLKLNRIPEELETMGEYFQSAGYRTYAAADNLNISHEMGFAQGFEKFETLHDENAPKLNAVVKEWLSGPQDGAKRFIYLHYMDPHRPYLPRRPWYQGGAGKEQRELAIEAYDSEIAYVDQHLRELFEAYGWLKDSVVVLTADHGEEFGDHGTHGHGKTLYTEVTRVPLVVYYPGISAGRVADNVHTIDILPTLGELLELQRREGWSGRSLVSAMRGEHGEPRYLYSELLRREEHHLGIRQAIIYNNAHLVRATDKQGEVSEELYDLNNDLTETTNLIDTMPQLALPLRATLTQFAQKKSPTMVAEVSIPVDDKAIEELKSLGYVE